MVQSSLDFQQDRTWVEQNEEIDNFLTKECFWNSHLVRAAGSHKPLPDL